MSGASLRLPLVITQAANPLFIGKVFTAPRTSWALEMLIANGTQGLRTTDCSAMQLGYYIWCIRQELGDDAIITRMEKHYGPFAGEHARYILADQTIEVERIEHSKRTKPSAAATVMASSLSPNSENGVLSDAV
jgi:hypothetical protein